MSGWIVTGVVCGASAGGLGASGGGGFLDRLSYANEGGFDLIVIGHGGHSELWGRLLGDTADRISDHAHCSVLIVKHPA